MHDHHHHHHLHIMHDPAMAVADWGSFIVMLSFSFFASFHCVFMCTPLVCAVLGQKESRLKEILTYNMTRVGSYCVLGAGLGLFSATLGAHWTNLSKGLTLALGCILILAAGAMFALKGTHLIDEAFAKLANTPVKFLQTAARRSTGVKRAALLGLVTALLPCMTLTPSYLVAASSGTVTGGALTMLGFGLGTLPVMLASPTLAREATKRIPEKYATKTAAVFLLIAGIITIWRGL